MKYFIVTPPCNAINETAIVNYLLGEKLAVLHLRKPDYSIDQMKEYLININTSLHNKIVIHSHHELINEFNLRGIHFTHHNKKSIYNYIDYNGTKSISTHSFDEINSLPTIFNYYFLSPVYRSISKSGYGIQNISIQSLTTFINQNPQKNIVGLSGITHKNIGELNASGIFGAAILGSFWNHCAQIDRLNEIDLFFQKMNNTINAF